MQSTDAAFGCGIEGHATYLCVPSSGLPACRRLPSDTLVLALGLRDGLPPGFCVEALPGAVVLEAGIELTEEVI